jgi:hypothetical protein
VIHLSLNGLSRDAPRGVFVLSRAVMKHWCIGLLIVAACGGGGDGDDGPTFSDEHPRIYLQANKDRLTAALAANGPAAARFKQSVDRWVAEADAFPAWHAALVGQLTGDPKYCAAAVTAIDKQVKDAETEIASGDTPYVASDSYLEAGELIGDLALGYDWWHGEVGCRRAPWGGRTGISPGSRPQCPTVRRRAQPGGPKRPATAHSGPGGDTLCA